jgi:hypothetical protein
MAASHVSVPRRMPGDEYAAYENLLKRVVSVPKISRLPPPTCQLLPQTHGAFPRRAITVGQTDSQH